MHQNESSYIDTTYYSLERILYFEVAKLNNGIEKEIIFKTAPPNEAYNNHPKFNFNVSSAYQMNNFHVANTSNMIKASSDKDNEQKAYFSFSEIRHMELDCRFTILLKTSLE